MDGRIKARLNRRPGSTGVRVAGGPGAVGMPAAPTGAEAVALVAHCVIPSHFRGVPLGEVWLRWGRPVA
jgi:hypothetical protein